MKTIALALAAALSIGTFASCTYVAERLKSLKGGMEQSLEEDCDEADYTDTLDADTASLEGHLKFKGIPIGGSMKAFCRKLKAKGFEYQGTEDGIKAFSGDFTGRKALVGVSGDPDGDTVYGVGVMLPGSKDWRDLVETFNCYKALYTEKYGKPATCREHNPSFSDSNISLMHELSEGTVDYRAVWTAPGGTITMTIEKAHYSEGQVAIVYRDDINTATKKQRDLDEI